MLKDLCFEIIQTCPNNCLFCSSCAGMNETAIIELDMFKKTIDHFMSIGGIQEISISGGEPFLHPNLFEMIEYCKRLGIRVVLFTSGVKRNTHLSQQQLDELRTKIFKYYSSVKDLPEDLIEKYTNRQMSIYEHYNNQVFSALSHEELKYLKGIGLDKIVFDFQGAERETYDYLMGSDHFTLVEQSMLRAVSAELDIDVHFVPMKVNYREFQDLIEILNIAEIKKLSILNFVPQGRGKENQDLLMMNEEELNEFAQIYEKCKLLFKGEIRVGIPLINDDEHKCTAGLDKLVIKYDGTVLPCPAFKEYDLATLNKLGIKTPNIFTDLSAVKVHNGTRAFPLCKKLYDFTGTIK